MPRTQRQRSDSENTRQKEASRRERDIAPVPAIVNPPRKAAAEASLKAFLDGYFPHKFSLPWSRDHLLSIDRLESGIRNGGLFAWAMPRGSGKTTLVECACLWAVLTGLQEFVLLIGASKDHAINLISSIKAEIESNDLLAEDWPEVCYPIGRLEGIVNRSAGQLCDGERTHIRWRGSEIVLPTIAGSRASGAIIRVAGITGAIRGAKFTRPDGHSVRPSLVVLDDPQTDRSARSLNQCQQRERIINGAVMGLAGPGRKINVLAPMTVIQQGDLADTLLDRDRHPDWQGERFKMVYSFPGRMDLWQEYADIRAEALRNGGTAARATEYYIDHQAEMDAGAAVAWPERMLPDQASGIEHAMALFFKDRKGFLAEYQNTPEKDSDETGQLEAAAIASRTNGLARATVPREAVRITAFVDIQKTLLYYVVVAWRDSFEGSVVSYGSYPDQNRRYFTLADAQRTLAAAAPGTALEGSIHAGLTQLGGAILTADWRKDDGTALKVERLMIDANWGASTDTVYGWCRASQWGAVVIPSHGRYIGAASKPWSEYKSKPGERLGHHWQIPLATGNHRIRHVAFDANFWKTFVGERLQTPMGDRGALTIYGAKGEDHRMFADQCCAEYKERTKGRGRELDERRIRPEHNDNHLWDCLVGCAVGASMQGCTLPEAGQSGRPKPKRVSYAEMQRRKDQPKGGKPV